VSANDNDPWLGPVVDKVPALAPNQVWVHDCRVYGQMWHTDRDTCASCGKARPVAEKPAKAAEPTRTPHATPADVTMLWEAIDQLKARIDALEGVKAAPDPLREFQYARPTPQSGAHGAKPCADTAKTMSPEILRAIKAIGEEETPTAAVVVWLTASDCDGLNFAVTGDWTGQNAERLASLLRERADMLTKATDQPE